MVDRRQTPRRIDEPEPCFIRMRVSRGGPWLPARIFRDTRHIGFGLTMTGLVGELDGRVHEVDAIWTSGERITEYEWRELVRDRKIDKPF